MVATLFAITAIVAVLAVTLRRARVRREERNRPGASAATAIVVDRFDAIDGAVRRERCRCGGGFLLQGEGSAGNGDRRLRVATIACRECGTERRIHFDVSAAFS